MANQQRQPKPGRGRPRKPVAEGTTNVQVSNMPTDLWAQAKIQAIKEGRDTYLLVQDALREYLERKRREEFEASKPVYE